MTAADTCCEYGVRVPTVVIEPPQLFYMSQCQQLVE
jgi:hypothetical protein